MGFRLRSFGSLLVMFAVLLAAASPGLRVLAQSSRPAPPGQPPGASGATGQGQTGQAGQAATGAAAGQGQVAQPPQLPTFRTGVNFVRVDAIVSDKDGRAVTDLKQGDFEVTEDGKPQTIETFKFVSVSGEVAPGAPEPREIRSDYDEESEAARDDVRLFVIFLDDYHVRRGGGMAIKLTLKAFIEKQLGPNDLIGVMFPLTPVSALLMSHDRNRVEAAIDEFQGRKYDYTPLNDFEEQYAMAPAVTVEQVRNQVTLSALKSLMVHLGSLREGRKAVILVSEGFSNILPPQLNDAIAGIPGFGNPASQNPMARVDDRTSFFASLDIDEELRSVYDAANRNNAAIYAVDPRGLATNEFDLSQNVNQTTDLQFLQATLDTLRVLSDQTDGRAIINRNDLDVGLKQVVRDSSAYYLIGYSSARSGADGKFHDIKVKVHRPGIQVRARKGYWALTKEELAKSLAPPPPAIPSAVVKALGSISEPQQGRYVRSWLGTTRGEGGTTRVTFVWEPLPPVPGVHQGEATSVSLLAAGAGGRTYYQGRVGADTPGVAAQPGAAEPAASSPPGVRGPASVSFDAPPGPIELRIMVQDDRGETLDTDVRDVTVPELSGPHVALSTPAVFRTANAREYRAIAAAPDPVPTPSREFSRTERLLIRFETFAPAGETPVVTARVLNRVGNGMVDVPVRPPVGPAAYYQVDLPLAGFAAGEYLLEIKAKGAQGEATELVPMKVKS
jgi:VWFA-related protein